MKTIFKKQDYVAPSARINVLSTERVLCSSNSMTVTLDEELIEEDYGWEI
jgi:hypothetical protein